MIPIPYDKLSSNGSNYKIESGVVYDVNTATIMYRYSDRVKDTILLVHDKESDWRLHEYN